MKESRKEIKKLHQAANVEFHEGTGELMCECAGSVY